MPCPLEYINVSGVPLSYSAVYNITLKSTQWRGNPAPTKILITYRNADWNEHLYTNNVINARCVNHQPHLY
ncbi:hypothetical protein NIES22_11840 [Calothrix brevissima NIES-22]|nr:hypothetical protein NIES22_11840 [Calothrix brevissima NIES-22]